jgi:hypothetical protein
LTHRGSRRSTTSRTDGRSEKSSTNRPLRLYCRCAAGPLGQHLRRYRARAFLLGKSGRYVAIDVARDSIGDGTTSLLDTRISPYYHFAAENELCNSHGTRKSMDFRLRPRTSRSIASSWLSVFHVGFGGAPLHDGVPSRPQTVRLGLCELLSLDSQEAIATAQVKGNTPWKATFAHPRNTQSERVMVRSPPGARRWSGRGDPRSRGCKRADHGLTDRGLP